MKRGFVPKKTKGNLFSFILHAQNRRRGFPPTRLFSKNTLFLAKNWQFLAIFGLKLFFFCADGSATPNRLLQYIFKHISLDWAP